MTNPQPPVTFKGNIIIADDHLIDLQLLTRLLLKQGYQVRPVQDGGTAVTAAQMDPPDLMLIDVAMPKLSGYDVCVQLKADLRTCNVPIIFLSASNEAFDKLKAFSHGGVDYITKPFQSKEVLARVEMHLAHRRAQQELEEKNRQLEHEIAKRAEAEALLQTANAVLEQRVETRTAELMRANSILRQEIDERIQVEQTLSTTVKRFQSLIEYSADIVAILDKKGYFRYVSPSARRILGYSSADLVGQRIFDLVHRDDNSDLVRTLTAGLHELNATARLSFRFPHYAGGWRVLGGTARNMLDEPTIGGVLLNLHEITVPQHVQQSTTAL